MGVLMVVVMLLVNAALASESTVAEISTHTPAAHAHAHTNTDARTHSHPEEDAVVDILHPYPTHNHHGPRRRALNESMVVTRMSAHTHNGTYMEMKRFDSPWNILGHVTKIFDPV